MRLMSWNCLGGLSRKLSILEVISPDIAVLQECSHKDARDFANGRSMLWRTKSSAENENKGMAVVCLNPAFSLNEPAMPEAWRQMLETDPSRLDLFIPIEIHGPQAFNLLATWSFSNREKGKSLMRKLEGPILMATRLLNAWLSEPRTIIAGDFNHSPVFDKYTDVNFFRTHTEAFEALNLTSLYHSSRAEAFGLETCPSHRWQGKKYFTIDYIFADLTSWQLESFDKMSFSDLEQAGVKSDHTPIWADLVLP